MAQLQFHPFVQLSSIGQLLKGSGFAAEVLQMKGLISKDDNSVFGAY